MSYNTTTDLLLKELIDKIELLTGATTSIGNAFGSIRGAYAAAVSDTGDAYTALGNLTQVSSLSVQNIGSGNATITVGSNPSFTLPAGKSFTFYGHGGNNVMNIQPIGYDATGTTLLFTATA